MRRLMAVSAVLQRSLLSQYLSANIQRRHTAVSVLQYSLRNMYNSSYERKKMKAELSHNQELLVTVEL